MGLTAVMIDNREPQAITNLKFGGVPTVVTTLEAGDLWASCSDDEMVLIERKTPNDLLNSIKDGRLFMQCANLRNHSPWAYLVVTGPLINSGEFVIAEGRLTGWRWDDVWGAILKCQELGVCVTFCRDDREYESAVIRLARRERNKDVVLEPRFNGRIMSPGEQVLIALPGIGYERAQQLLVEFDNHVGHALAWLTWQHKNPAHDIAGIGAGTKLGVRKALGLSDDEELDVWKPEKITKEREKVAA